MGESRFPPSRRFGGESNEVCSPRSRHSFPLALDRFASLAARLRQLWRRRWRYDSPTHSDGPDGHGRKCASDVGLGRQRWGDQLLREALHNDGRTLHANRDADNYELRRHGPDKRNEILLCRFRVQLSGPERKLHRSKCDSHSSSDGTFRTDKRHGDSRQRAGGGHLDRQRRSNQL